MSMRIEKKTVWTVVDEINGNEKWSSVTNTFNSEEDALIYTKDQKTKEKQLDCFIRQNAVKLFEVGAICNGAESVKKDAWEDRVRRDPDSFCILIHDFNTAIQRIINN